MNEQFSTEEYMYFINKLRIYDAFFYKMWLLGKPIYTNSIGTAAIAFDKEGGCVQFLINYDFWQKLSDVQKEFIICHECSHIFYDHGQRGIDIKNQEKANIAMDIVINHNLAENFGFDRQAVDPTNSYCWLDTVFKNNDSILKNQSFEYYYNNINNETGASLVDVHTFLDQISERSVFDRIKDSMTREELDQLSNKFRGDSDGGSKLVVDTRPVKHKKKWETVIKKWSENYLTKITKDKTQWVMENRRFSLLENDLMIPSEFEVEDINNKKSKIDVWFFQDTSGSCRHFAHRFFKAAKSLPPKRFNIRMFCFSTRVHETSLETGKLYGFGGTSFSIIENAIINRITAENIKYPSAVFVITDGEGTHVRPKYPSRWHWFLTSGGIKEYIPPLSKIHRLENYE